MAQLEIPDGFGNLQLFWSVAEGDQLASTAIGVELTPDSLNESDVADTAQDVVSQFAPSMTTEDRWVGWKLTFTAGSTLLAIEGPLDSPGTSVQDPVLPTAAVLARKRTLGVGRAFRGRMFLPRPLRIDCNTDGTLISGGISDWQDACDAAFNALLSSPWVQLVVLLHGEGGPAPTPLRSPPEGLSVAPVVGTQRLRLNRQQVI